VGWWLYTKLLQKSNSAQRFFQDPMVENWWATYNSVFKILASQFFKLQRPRLLLYIKTSALVKIGISKIFAQEFFNC
jgi:hypothetical protein